MTAAPDQPVASAPDTAQHDGTPASAAGMQNMHGLLEVLDRGGAIVQRMKVRHWPVTVGRSLAADLVLTDSHIAAEHLRIDRPPPSTNQAGAASNGVAPLRVEVLDTVNGVRHGRRRHGRDSHFGWNGDDELTLGRFRLRLLLAETALAPEQVLAAFRWRRAATTLALLAAFLGLQCWGAWLGQTEPGKSGVALFKIVATGAAIALAWAGMAALLTKLFTGQPQFWRHLRIVLAAFVAAILASNLLSVMAFAFGWSQLGRLGAHVDWAAIGIALLVQEWVVAHNRRRGVQLALVASLAVIGIGAAIWFAGKDGQSGPRLATLYPPGWRMAAPVPLAHWMDESRGLRERLDVRLRQGDENDESDASDAATGGDEDDEE